MANRPGTVGRLCPMMEYRLDPAGRPSRREAGFPYAGAPKVMLGTARGESRACRNKTARMAWHDTGDIVTIDAGASYAIKGRAKRFASRGGARWL